MTSIRKKLLVFLSILCSLVLAGALWIGIDFYFFLKKPLSPYQGLKKLTISKGTGLKEVALLLKQEGIISNSQYFIALCLYKRLSEQIKSGEYQLSGTMLPGEIIEIITSAKVVYYPVTIPEGYTLRGIARLLARQGLVNRERFLSLSRDKKLISELDVSADSLEGYLFPSTYYFSKGMKEEMIINEMVFNFQKLISAEFKKKMREIGFTLHETVTLASLIEKETNLKEEKSLISAVFHNRLKKKMLLQCDPTVIYALNLENKYRGRLRKKDLAIDSLYNTYKYPGLPPGPIASPGYDSLRAAIYPDSGIDYLFFVLKDDGRHFFSKNYTEHRKAVRRYRLN